MPNDPDFIQFVVDQIDPSCDIHYRHMLDGTTFPLNGSGITQG